MSELERILRDAKAGQPVSIPAGMEIKTTHPQHYPQTTTKRQQTVYPHFVDRYSDGRVVVTWAGAGGYWKRLEGYPDGVLAREGEE